MRTWFRVVLPPHAIVLGFVVIYAVSFVPTWIYWYYGGEGTSALEKTGASPREVGLLMLGVLALAYGTFRVFAFHPAFSDEYRVWLNQTPWRYGLPLVKGPVHLVPQDVAILSLLSGLAVWHSRAFWWTVPCVFLTCYLLCLTLSFLITRRTRHAYLIIFGLGGAVWLYWTPLGVGLLLGLLYIIAYHGFVSWLKIPELPIADDFSIYDTEANRNRRLGWPYDLLGPQQYRTPVSYGWAVALAILTGWWGFVLMDVVHHAEGRKLIVGTFFLSSALLGFGRLGTYIWGYLPPISLWGRLRTFRWCIPGYDAIFIPPTLVFLLMSSTKFLTLECRLPTEFVYPAILAAEVFIAFGFPPSLDAWRLTGNHRIVATVPKLEMQQLP